MFGVLVGAILVWEPSNKHTHTLRQKRSKEEEEEAKERATQPPARLCVLAFALHPLVDVFSPSLLLLLLLVARVCLSRRESGWQ